MVFAQAQESALILFLTTIFSTGICNSHVLLASISLYKKGKELYKLWLRSLKKLAATLLLLCNHFQ